MLDILSPRPSSPNRVVIIMNRPAAARVSKGEKQENQIVLQELPVSAKDISEEGKLRER